MQIISAATLFTRPLTPDFPITSIPVVKCLFQASIRYPNHTDGGATMSPTKIKAGASAYNWRTKQPTLWHPEPVEDVEDFCRHILDRALSSWSMFLREEEYNDTLQELIILTWRLERRYDPDKSGSFSSYAAWLVSQRSVDFGPRRVLGRHGTRTHDYMSPTEDPYEGHSMAESFDGLSLDREDDSDAYFERIFNERSGEISRKTRELGIGQDGLFEAGDRGTR